MKARISSSVCTAGPGSFSGPDGDVAHILKTSTSALEARDCDLRVCGVREPVGIDDGQIGCVGGSDGDVAAG